MATAIKLKNLTRIILFLLALIRFFFTRSALQVGKVLIKTASDSHFIKRLFIPFRGHSWEKCHLLFIPIAHTTEESTSEIFHGLYGKTIYSSYEIIFYLQEIT